MKLLFVVNPRSGRPRSIAEILSLLRGFLSERALDADMVMTEGPGHATEIARDAVSAGVLRSVAGGGDGTVNEVAQALIHTPAALGLVPCGSGNGLALHLGLPRFLADALEQTIPPDLIDPLSSRWDRPSPFSGLSSLAGSDDRRQKAIVCPTAHRDATMSVMKLTFWGAAGTVTGSMHLLENDGKRYLLDCGLFQGRRKDADLKNRHLPFPGDSIDAVVLSHAHIDHSGNLPTLVKHGFAGPIFSTPATIDLCNWMLRDTAHIQEKDAEFLNKRQEKRQAAGQGRPNGNGIVQPLYTTPDAERTLPLFRPVPYHQPFQLSGTLSYEAYDAGHILGSSCVVLNETSGGAPLRLTYSGDVGRPNLPIIRDPEKMPPTDYLIMESTYGGRLHKHVEHVVNKLADVVNRTARRGGRIIVPAFAVGRTQQLVLLLHQLFNEKRIPNIPLFVDSPLALNVTQVHRDHPECFDAET